MMNIHEREQGTEDENKREVGTDQESDMTRAANEHLKQTIDHAEAIFPTQDKRSAPETKPPETEASA